MHQNAYSSQNSTAHLQLWRNRSFGALLEWGSIIDETVLVGVISAAAVVIGAFFGIVSTNIKGFLDARRERRRELADVRRRFLEPLRLAAVDLHGHLYHVRTAFSENNTDNLERRRFYIDTFQAIKQFGWTSRDEFFRWCNDHGYFAVATLYRTAVYFWAAERVKKELLFTDARASEDDRLLEELDEVRDSLGGTSGIWQTLQDSIGSDMARGDGKTASYREFCSLISDASEKVWLWRLINFFADIQNDEQQKVVTDSLAALLRLRGLLDPDGTPLSAQRSSLGTAVAPPSSPGRGRITG